MARAPAVEAIEAPPEADRLEGFPHPREALRVLGHRSAEAAIAEAIGAGRMHHAWLLSGPDGIGKATLAYRIARFVLARPEERIGGADDPLAVTPGSTADRQVRVLSHPGLLVIRRPWDQKAKRHTTAITVDEVRRIKGFLSFSAGPDVWRVVIVDKADELNIAAANALLKSLEEPPARALFLLVTSEPGRLLTTIRSRCRRLDLAPLGLEDLRDAVAAVLASTGGESDAERFARNARLAQGSVRRFLALSASDAGALYDRIASQVGLLPKVDWLAIHTLSDELSGAANEQAFEQFYELLLDLLARLIRTGAIIAEGGSADAGEEARMAERLIAPGGLATWAELWETIVAKKAETAALNLDRKSLILETFARLQQAARG